MRSGVALLFVNKSKSLCDLLDMSEQSVNSPEPKMSQVDAVVGAGGTDDSSGTERVLKGAAETGQQKRFTLSVIKPYKRAVHPFLCRLDETAAFTVTAPNALIAAGFASMGMGLFTLFRPTPVLLFLLASHLKEGDLLLLISKDLVLAMTLSWDAILLFVLLVLGFVLTFSVKIKKRSALLLHPWGLLALYFDVFVWLTMTLCFHVELLYLGLEASFFQQIQYPVAYFAIIYVDSIVFCLLHYIYATYFIAAELSVIERCY